MTPTQANAIRKAAGLTQAALARLLGFSRRQSVGEYESGMTPIGPQTERLLLLLGRHGLDALRDVQP